MNAPDIQHRGNCQVCGRLHAIVKGKVAKHGYTVKEGWFEGVSTVFKMEDGALVDGIRDCLEGMSVSVDVSTGDHDAMNRYHGTITEVMDASSADKFGVVLLVQNPEPNFEVKK